MMTPITILNVAGDLYDGYLLPDAAHALYVADSCAFLIAVIPSGEHYVQTLEAFVVSIDAEPDIESVARVYRRLMMLSAYELLTRFYNSEFDAYEL
ncbi:hypothetical protein AB4Z21_33790 [Paenibacillus sp. MCAF20]